MKMDYALLRKPLAENLGQLMLSNLEMAAQLQAALTEIEQLRASSPKAKSTKTIPKPNGHATHDRART